MRLSVYTICGVPWAAASLKAGSVEFGANVLLDSGVWSEGQWSVVRVYWGGHRTPAPTRLALELERTRRATYAPQICDS
jgi:hypothetical protein